jgi:Na+-translocating ferredoxin:NAD+ oxidoreductase RnfC subunit
MTDILRLIFDAGVSGGGGAGFPAHAKYAKSAELFLVNGAECEPLLKTDQYIMRHFADRICGAALAVAARLQAKRIIFALKKNYAESAEALRSAAAGLGGGIDFFLMDSVYPAGDEQTLLYEASGLTVPPGGIPLDAGAVVSNAGTMLAVADALDGKPLTHKFLTVSGEVAGPAVLRVPVGISFAECVGMAGGARIDDFCVIAGGPIMGRVISREELETEVVTKTTSGILVLPADHYLRRRRTISVVHTKNRARAACIQCGMCSASCPRSLLGSPLRPHLVMRAFASSVDMDGLLEIEAARNAMYCCECGICEVFACPMELLPCQVNIILKKEMRRRKIPVVRAEAGAVSPDRPYRLIPSKRMASRAELLAYYDLPVKDFHEAAECRRVSIPLQMHIGAPAASCVRPGQRVRAGDQIGDVAWGTLGAKVHASISGVVREAGDRVVIEQEEAGV